MKDIAPNIKRQRLLVEGFFEINIDENKILEFYDEILKKLNLRTYGKPIIHSTGNQGKEINQGYDCFIPLIDSGIALYIWGNVKFFSAVIYTCKDFDSRKAVKFCKDFFQSKKVVYRDF